jgi:DNA primase large subunit
MEPYTQTDLAKYPFLKGAAERVKKLDLTIQDLAKPELRLILRRSQERIEKAIRYTNIGQRSENLVEILSYPVAVVIATATKNNSVKKRYALAEAKQAYRELQMEPNEKLEVVARDFGWNLSLNQENAIPMDFALNFSDYLRNSTHLQDTRWKLVNRILARGKVYLSKHEIARLLQEEIQRRIEKRLNTPGQQPAFPAEILAIAEKINELAKEHVCEPKTEALPQKISQSAFPPCIATLYDAASKGCHLSHIGRFTLTSFLASVGMSPEKVAEVFKTSSDYNAQLTSYQVKHIAGEGGAGTKYKPPSCSTLQTHGVCSGKSDLCLKIRHPLAYYRQRLKSLEPKPRLERS